MAVEVMPGESPQRVFPVHQHFLVEAGVYMEVVHRRRASPIPDAVRQEIDRLKALYDGFHYRELARILFIAFGAPIDPKTVKTLWQESPVACQGHLALWDYHTHPDRYL